MSSLSDVYEIAKRTVAATSGWQAWTGSTDSGQAKAHIHVAEIPAAEMTAANLPRCRINEGNVVQSALGPLAGAIMRGEIKLTFFGAFDASTTAATLEQQKDTFRQNVGRVLDDLHAISQSGRDEYLFVREISTADPIDFPDLDESDLGSLISGSWTVAFGPDGVSEGG